MSTYYTEDHVWLNLDGDIATVGITHHAQDALGDVVFVELPSIGENLPQKAVAAVVESVKAAADVYMPASGVVTEVNEALRQEPALANTDPLGSAWFFKIKLSQMTELEHLINETAYQKLTA